MGQNKELMIYPEIIEGELANISRELSALARRLADELGGVASAVLLGSSIGHHARELIEYGMDKVYVADDPLLEGYQAYTHLAVIERLCRELQPEALFIGQTLTGRDLAPRLAFRLDTGLATDCVEFGVDPDSKALLMTRPIYGGKALAVMACDTRPQIATVRSKTNAPAERDESRTGEIIPIEPKLDPAAMKTRLIERVKAEEKGPKLEEAEVVVSGGRGLGRVENFRYLEELAKLLGGAVGASRAAIDNGWVPSTQQVGLTGKIVSPKLYIAVGISGAVQHMAGCGSSKCIVAINTDPEAPIFQRAHFGVVADFKQVLPTIIELCR